MKRFTLNFCKFTFVPHPLGHAVDVRPLVIRSRTSRSPIQLILIRDIDYEDKKKTHSSPITPSATSTVSQCPPAWKHVRIILLYFLSILPMSSKIRLHLCYYILRSVEVKALRSIRGVTLRNQKDFLTDRQKEAGKAGPPLTNRMKGIKKIIWAQT